MITTVVSIFGSIGTIAAAVLAYKSSKFRQRRQAAKEVDQEAAEMEARRDEIRHAVFEKNDSRVNEIVNELLTPGFALFALVSFVTIFGCQTTPREKFVYIASDRRIESCTNSIGIACKAVPDAVFAELLEKAEDLKRLRRENDIEKRISK